MFSWLTGGSDDSEVTSSEIAKLIDMATNSMLLNTDWTVNLEISDYANRSSQNAKLTTKVLFSRLGSVSSNRSMELLLGVIETVAKNGNHPVLHSLAGSESFMREVGGIYQRRFSDDVREKTLALIQELGQTYEPQRAKYPGFYNNYAKMTSQGIIFPISNLRAPPVAPKSTFDATEEFEEKIKDDLSVLVCKLDVGDRLISGEIYSVDEKLDVLDFLLQCQPRMVELIEASAQGILDDKMLEYLLAVNDRLCRTVTKLETLKVEDRPMSPPKAPTETIITSKPRDSSKIPKLRAAPIARSRENSSTPSTPPPVPTEASEFKQRFPSYSRSSSTNQNSSSNQSSKAEETNLEDGAPLIRKKPTRQGGGQEEEEDLLVFED